MPSDYSVRVAGCMAVRHTSADGEWAETTLRGLQWAVRSVEDYLDLDRGTIEVQATLVPDRDEYDRCVGSLLGLVAARPSPEARVAQPQGKRLVLLSPRAYAQDVCIRWWGCPVCRPEAYTRIIHHEVVHIAEEALSPNIEAVPLWWSEGLATYLCEEWRHQTPERQVVRQGVSRSEIPRLDQIQAEGRSTGGAPELCYTWAWTVLMYLEERYGRDTVVRVVRECADGDVCRVIGIDPRDLEANWQHWLLHLASWPGLDSSDGLQPGASTGGKCEEGFQREPSEA